MKEEEEKKERREEKERREKRDAFKSLHFACHLLLEFDNNNSV